MPPSHHTNPTTPVSLEDRIAVYWPIDDQFFPGVITNINTDGKVVMHYDDGDVETLLLSDETWKFIEFTQPPRTGSSRDPPSTAQPVPVAEVPVAEVPVAEVPVAEVPVAEVPVAEVPVAEVPVAEVPVAEVPVAEVPVAEVPVAEVPVAEVPVAEVPVAEVPVSEVSVAEVPVAEDSVVEVPVAEDSVVEVPVAEITQPRKLDLTRQGTASNARTGITGKDSRPVTTDVPASRKRLASSSMVPNRVSKKPFTLTRQLHVINDFVKNTPSVPVSSAIVAIPLTRKGILAKSRLKPSPRVALTRTTAQSQLARPITSGVPLSGSKPPLQPTRQLGQPPRASLQCALEPLMTSFNAQLNTQVSRISSIRDMLLNLTPRFTELDERCKTLRADVDILESEITSRTEMKKVLNDALVKQMHELKCCQTVMLEQLKKDFRSFLQDEMKAVEKHLVEKIRTKSAEVFKELFSGVADSIKDTALKNANEDMSIPTRPSVDTDKKQGAVPSRSK